MGSIYFQKIQSLDFFCHLTLENSEKYWPIDTGLVKFWQRDLLLFCVKCILTFSEHVLCQISILVCRWVKRVLNYYSTKFHEILTSGSVEITAFPLNRAVTIFWLTAHALHLTGSSWLLVVAPYKQSQKGRVFPNRITFDTLKNKGFSHMTNCLIVKTKKKHGT